MTIKTIIIAILIIAAIGGFLYYTGGTPEVSPGLLTAEADPQAEAATMRVVNLLNEISQLRIDRSLFANPTYQTLTDNTIPVMPQNVGRVNPFAPLPGVPRSPSASAAR